MNVLTPYDLEHESDQREGQRWPWIVLGSLVAVLLMLAALVLWVKQQIDPSGPPGEPVRVQVEKGMSVDDVGELLADKGVITNATVFRFYTQLQGPSSVQAGEYTFHRNESMGEVSRTLGEGPQADAPVVLTVPEGLTLKQLADKVGELPGRSADRFLEVAGSGVVRSQYQPPASNNLEGLLLPETYFIGKDEDETAILRRLVEAFDSTATNLGIAGLANRLEITPYQAVIVASMVEREARVSEDRGPIARVIYNRLDTGMRLQIDATVQYALGENKETLLFSDLEVNSPYNTYKIDGLPPAPIASPGKAALEAALRPPAGPWLYYVLSDTNGKHAFATTGDEFNRLVAEARKKGVL